MKKIILLSVMGLLMSAANSAETDVLWQKTLTQFKATSAWVAQDIRTQLEAQRKDQPAKIHYVQSTLSSWDKQNPVYSSINTDSQWHALPEQKNNADALNKMIASLDKSKTELLDGKNIPKRLDNETLDGKNFAVFHLSEGEMGQKITVKMWVNPDTACLHKMETSLHITLYADADPTSLYAEPNKNGVCLQNQMQGMIDIQIPFKKAKLNFWQSHGNWVGKPAS